MKTEKQIYYECSSCKTKYPASVIYQIPQHDGSVILQSHRPMECPTCKTGLQRRVTT